MYYTILYGIVYSIVYSRAYICQALSLHKGTIVPSLDINALAVSEPRSVFSIAGLSLDAYN